MKSKMSVGVRQADIDSDRHILVNIFNQNLPRLQHERRYDWLYQKNPYVVGKAWIVFDKKNR